MSVQQPSGDQRGAGLPEPEHPVWQMANVFPPTPHGEEAWAAYQRDLPELLETARGQWVAYHGARRLGVKPLHTRLYEDCVREGVPVDELVICQIEVIEGEEYMGMGGCWIEECP